MISVEVKRKDGIIEELTIKGHAMFDTYGKDIVCAGVSSSLITTINAIISFDENAISYKENIFELENIKKDNITNKLLENLVEVLKETQKQYGKNIKVKEENLWRKCF